MWGEAKVKIQLLVSNKPYCPIEAVDDLIVNEFKNAAAFDAFELTIISLQDKELWKNRDNNHSWLNDRANIISLRQMMDLSAQSKCLILLPCNYSFLYDYGYDPGFHTQRYRTLIPLKDFITDFAKSPIGDLFSSSLPVCFGASKTKLPERELPSAFSFIKTSLNSLKQLLRSDASTTTAVMISETLAATTLQISCIDDLLALVEAIFPPLNHAKSLPAWLDEIDFYDEEEQRSKKESIDGELIRLSGEKARIEEVLSDYQNIKAILCFKDFELEDRVRHIIAKISEVDDTFIDTKEEDFRFCFGDTTFLIEVKGSVGGLKRQHVSRAYDHVQIEMDAKDSIGDASAVKGILIFASQIEMKPEERDSFPESQLTIASRNDIAVLSTEVLLRCYEAYLEGRLTSDGFKETLRTSSGFVGLEEFGLNR